jgi:hypothetical protein
MNLFPKNTAADWTTKLQSAITLHGQWEVALVEMIYPNSAYNIPEDQFLECRQVVCTTGDCIQRASIRVPAGIYEAQELVKCIEDQAPKTVHWLRANPTEPFPNAFRMYVIPSERKARIVFQNLRCELFFPAGSEHLRQMLGFKSQSIRATDSIAYLGLLNARLANKKPEYATKVMQNHVEEVLFLKDEKHPTEYTPVEVVAPKCINTVYGNQTLFVYCDAADFSVVGDTNSQILRTVPIKANSAFQMVVEKFDAPHYVPVIRNHIENIQVSIASDLGDNAKFQIGKSLIKLHFRRAGGMQ